MLILKIVQAQIYHNSLSPLTSNSSPVDYTTTIHLYYTIPQQ